MTMTRSLASLLVLSLFVASKLVLGLDNDVCFEMLSNITAVDLKEHPAGNKLAVATRDGVVRLMTRPPVGSGEMASVTSTYLAISSRVLFAPFGEQGLLSFAFHPQFATNGRFFVSYICNGTANPDCQGPCYTAPLGKNCPYNTIVAEYSAGNSPLRATRLRRREVRKVLRFGRPFQTNNGGQIWFGPDGYLWYASGDGGSEGDVFNLAQNGASPFGKILRLDVDSPPNARLWGQYAIPPDNPFFGVPRVAPEIYALGFRNPWRSSVDPVTNVTFTGDVGQNQMEEVDVLTAGGNYGWSVWEGSDQFNSTRAPLVPIGNNYTFPILEYGHPSDGGAVAVVGGYVYRAARNPCLQGLYIFGDESGRVYTGQLYEANSNNLVTSGLVPPVNSTIGLVPPPSPNSPQSMQGTSLPDVLLAWAHDSAHELYRLSSNGVFRVVNSSMCSFSCEVGASSGSAMPLPPPPGGNGAALQSPAGWFLTSLLILLASATLL